MKEILIFVIAASLLTTSCFDECTFETCAAPNFNVINALVFNFDTTYSNSDIADAHIIKYTKGGNFSQALDTFYFTEQFNNNDYLMVLSDPEPFSSGGTLNLNSYENFDYIIKPNSTGRDYKVNTIQVKGEFSDCDCVYTNTQKTFELDSIATDRTGSNLQVTLN
jgi:hypothetical protein